MINLKLYTLVGYVNPRERKNCPLCYFRYESGGCPKDSAQILFCLQGNYYKLNGVAILLREI
jgi:hypothetical protein